MTAVEPVMDEAAARRITQRISLLSGSVRESITKLAELVEEAKAGNAHVALGYRSWTDYLAATLGAEPIVLPPTQRRELVGWLTNEGMSSRAIAPIVGTTHSTVVRDAQVVRDAPAEPIVARVAVDQETGEILEPAAPQTPRPDEASSPITSGRGPIQGRDGKTYTRPAPDPAREAQRAALADLTATPADVEYRQNFRKAYRAALGIVQFDPQRVAEVIDADGWDLLSTLPDDIAGFVDKVRALRPRNLRSIK